MADLSVRDLVVRYGDVLAVDRVSFAVAEGEFVSLLGPSGCGKTTTLRCIAGLESASSGEIRIGADLVVADGRETPPERRGVNMVFQSYAVWPHMSVFDNVAYGLRTRGTSRAELDARVAEVLRLVGLEGYGERYGTELSGGQQQRVAIARALAMSPELMLYDEPTSALDPETVGEVLQVMQELAREGMTSIVVTHEMGFARRAADRAVFMDAGQIVFSAPGDDFFTGPKPERVERFLGRMAH